MFEKHSWKNSLEVRLLRNNIGKTVLSREIVGIHSWKNTLESHIVEKHSWKNSFE
jgi:hypothetical protein